MTPFASVFQRMLWLVLVSFLSDYKTLPAFHPSEHVHTSEWRREKKFIRYRVYVLSLCLRLCLQQCGKGLHLISSRRLGTLHVCMQCVPMCVLHVILPLLFVPFYSSLCVYCKWFCPYYTSLSLVPEGVLHVILPLLYAPVTCPWVCTARDFAPAIRPCCPVRMCVLHVILLLLYVPVACPCVCTARDFVANTHCFDMSLQHEPSFFLVSTKPLWHHLISFFGPF